MDEAEEVQSKCPSWKAGPILVLNKQSNGASARWNFLPSLSSLPFMLHIIIPIYLHTLFSIQIHPNLSFLLQRQSKKVERASHTPEATGEPPDSPDYRLPSYTHAPGRNALEISEFFVERHQKH